MQAIIYHNPKCSKSCFALEYLEANNVEILIKYYLATGLTREEIFEILACLKADITDIFREDEEVFIKKKPLLKFISRDSLINEILEQPILLQRPIIMFKEKQIGIIARSEDSVASLLKYVGVDQINIG
ncbi:MAG: ArsC/Spx/MgsR family protein [Rickettsiales bacterium]